MSSGDRLVSWKRIARYLQRGERTVRRWAAEDGLPVHHMTSARHGSVFALAPELDAWLASRQAAGAQRVGTATALPAEQPGGSRTMLAVLPLDDLSLGQDLGPLVDGLLEELTSVLGRYNDLGVIARTSVLAYRGTTRPIREIGQELNVRYVIEGSVRSEGQRVRLTTQLIDTLDQTHLWAQSYDHRLDSPLAMQQELAQRVAADLGRVLLGRTLTVRVVQPSTRGPAADDYLEGRYLLNRMTASSIQRSVDCFDRAIARDPGFAPAWGARAEALQLLTIYSGVAPAAVMPSALEALTRALALDPESAEVHASLGYVHSTYTWDWQAAEMAFRRALDQNPSLAVAHQWFAECLALLGRFDEALHHADEARLLDPLSLAVACTRGHVLWLARRDDELIAAMTRILQMEPNYPLASILLALGYHALGDEAMVRNTCEDAGFTGGGTQPFDTIAALAHDLAGDTAALDAMLEQLDIRARHAFVSRYDYAACHLAAGRLDAAMAELEAACDEHVWQVTMIHQAAHWDPLRSHPRFAALLQRIGFPEIGTGEQQTGC